MSTDREQILQVGDELSAIAGVADLVKIGRVPIKMQQAEVGTPSSENGMTNVIFYNVPPEGFTLGKNGCTGVGDPIKCSIEYFDGKGETLGNGQLVAVRVSETTEMDKIIDAAREEFGY